MSITNTITMNLITYILSLFLLWLASKFLKFKRNSFKYALKATFILLIVSLFVSLFYFIFSPPFAMKLLIGLITSVLVWVYVIKKVYNITPKQAIITLIFAGFLGGIAFFIISFLIVFLKPLI